MENFNNNLNLKISENIGHISEYLINRHLENPNDIIPLFKFGDENNMELNELNNEYMFLINTDNYEELGTLCRLLEIPIGIITVGGDDAQKVCDTLVKAGVSAIWNFAPVHLKVPSHVVLQNENMASSLAVLLALTK